MNQNKTDKQTETFKQQQTLPNSGKIVLAMAAMARTDGGVGEVPIRGEAVPESLERAGIYQLKMTRQVVQ